MRPTTISLIVIVTGFFCQQPRTAAQNICTDAACLIESIPRTATQNTLLIQANLKTPSKNSWRLILNDSPIYESSQFDKDSVTPIRLGLKLRSGDNLLEFVSVGHDTKRWATHVYREPDISSQRIALVINGQYPFNNRGNESVMAIAEILSKNGIQAIPVQDSGAYSVQLLKIASQMKANDKLLIYYIGPVSVNGPNGDPSLNVGTKSAESPGVRLSSVIRELDALTLPSVSLVLDASPLVFTPETDRSKFTPYNPPWIGAIESSQSGFEVVLPNIFVLKRGDTWNQGFSKTFITQVGNLTGTDSCRTLRDYARSVRHNFPSRPQDLPIYFSSPSFQSYCLLPNSAVSPLIVNTEVEDALVKPYKRLRITIDLPSDSHATWLDVFVDGVIVIHRTLPPQDQESASKTVNVLMPIAFGKHLLTVEIGRGLRQIAIHSQEVPVDGEVKSNSKLSSGLSAAISGVHSSPNVVVRTGLTNVRCVVSDSKAKRVAYTVRNNGVILRRGYGSRFQEGDQVVINTRIPLLLGSNNISIEVDKENSYNRASIEIVRKLFDPVRAILVGIGQYKNISKTTAGNLDADSVRDLVLQYTTAGALAADGTETLTVLKDSGATLQNILSTLNRKDSKTDQDPLLRGSTAEPALFFYFAGLGETRGNRDQHPVQCLLPYDAHGASGEKCISLATLDELIDAWPSAVIILDTSFDGSAERLETNDNVRTSFSSRTLADFLSRSRGAESEMSTWGQGGINRLVLSAGRTNVAALETQEHGIFTYCLVKAVQRDASTEIKQTPEVDLVDAFRYAQSQTINSSQKYQIPVMQGMLSRPFMFSKTDATELEQEALGILSDTKQDFEAMRAVDSSNINHALRLLSKAALMQPTDSDSLQRARVELLLYAGNAISEDDRSVLENLSNDDPKSIIERKRLADWLRIRAELRMVDGDLDSAIADAERSKQLGSDSPVTLYTLAGLYATRLRYADSAILLDRILKSKDASLKTSLSDQQWARVIVWQYIFARLAERSKSDKILKEYVNEDTRGQMQKGWAKLGRWMRALVAPRSTNSTSELSYEEDWWHIVANYLIDPNKYEKPMNTYEEMTSVLDPKDPSAVNCMLHFYLAAEAAIASGVDSGKSEWELVLTSNQRQRVEYWIANSQLKEMARQTGN